MGRFNEVDLSTTTVKAHEIIKERTEDLEYPFLFAVIDQYGGLAVTENLEDHDRPDELWMQVLGGIMSIGVDFIAAAKGPDAAQAFVYRSLGILAGVADEAGKSEVKK